MESETNTINSNEKVIETITRNMNKKCKQIQNNFNVVDDDGVIKHTLSSILKYTRTFEGVSTGMTDKYKFFQ